MGNEGSAPTARCGRDGCHEAHSAAAAAASKSTTGAWLLALQTRTVSAHTVAYSPLHSGHHTQNRYNKIRIARLTGGMSTRFTRPADNRVADFHAVIGVSLIGIILCTCSAHTSHNQILAMPVTLKTVKQASADLLTACSDRPYASLSFGPGI